MRVKAGWECPTCGGEIFTEAGGGGVQLVCGADSTHRWTDMFVFRSLNPKQIKLAPKPDVIQNGYVEMSLKVPESTKAALQARFGDKLNGSLVAILATAAEPGTLTLNASDMERLGARLGGIPKSSSELFGKVFALGEELKSTKDDMERMVRTSGIKKNGTGITVDLAEQTMKAVAKASDSGYSLEDYISNYLRDSIANDWIG